MWDWQYSTYYSRMFLIFNLNMRIFHGILFVQRNIVIVLINVMPRLISSISSENQFYIESTITITIGFIKIQNASIILTRTPPPLSYCNKLSLKTHVYLKSSHVTSPGVLDNSTQRQPHLVAKVIANTRRGSGGPTKFPPPQGAIKMELYQVLILIVKLN